MEFRNPQFNQFGSIDCEIEHPEFGWIPFTATSDDPEGNAIYNAIVDSGEPIAPYHPPLPPVPDIISRRQFFQGLAMVEKISKAEALAAIKTGAIPAALQTILDGMLDDDARFDADMLLSGATEFNRDHPLVMVLAITQAMSEPDVDDFWRLCASL